MPLQKPIAPMMFPKDLAGVVNGNIPEGLLSGCGVHSAYSPFPELKMHHYAARCMIVLQLFAMAAGFNVRATGTTRTYLQQESIFDGVKYPATGRYLPNNLWDNYPSTKWATPADIRNWLSRLWKRIKYTASAAVPGTSNHGWALAIDFSEEYDGNPFTAEGITPEFTQWLIDNAHRFGYSAELQSEDWHWRYVAGDDLPYEVLAFEYQYLGGGEEEMNTAIAAIYTPSGDWWATHNYQPATFVMQADGAIRHAAGPDLAYAGDHAEVKQYPIKDPVQYEHLRKVSGTYWPAMI